MKKKKHNWLKRIVLGQCILSTALNIIAIGIVGYDIIMFAVTGKFTLFKSLNTVPYETVDESWNYVTTAGLKLWGDDKWAQKYVPFFFSLSMWYMIWLAILWVCDYIRNKPLLIISLIVMLVCLAIYFVYLGYIDGCVSYNYIREVIM